MTRVRTAMVTGSKGLIGRAFSERLTADGWTVYGCDVKDGGMDCREFFKDGNRVDLLLHAAAIVGGRAMIEGQPLSVATDLAIDSDFVQYVARVKPWRAVYFSSSAAYPIQYQSGVHAGPLSESDIELEYVRQPDAIYGWVKLTGEQVVRHANVGGASIHVYRPFSGFSTGQDLTYPWPSFIDRAQRRVDPFPIWGPGTQVRDWIHVSDIVNAVMATVDLDPAEVGPLNLCTGRGVSMLELAGMACAAAGYSPVFQTDLSAPTGVLHRVGDPTRMRQFYEPKILLEDAVDAAVRGVPVTNLR